MASLKDIKIKISGVGKTKQITKAMNMVASAKLRGAQSRMDRFRAYADRFQVLLADIAARSQEEHLHPLLLPRKEIVTTGIVLVTSDRGLCGSFNNNLIAAALKAAARKNAEGKRIVFFCVGRKGRDAVAKKGYAVQRYIPGQTGVIAYPSADRLGVELINAFQTSKLDEVIIIHGEFVSLMRQTPVTHILLPLNISDVKTPAPIAMTEYIYEPAGPALMAELLPRVIKALIYRGLLDTSTSEHAARMVAMDNATRNCNDLTKTLTKLFNKTRQAAITKDLMDIVGGAEALNG